MTNALLTLHVSQIICYNRVCSSESKCDRYALNL